MSRPRAKLTKNFPGCPVETTLSYLDGKWKGVILFHLMDGKLRFNELRRKLPSVTQRMLTKQLRELEEAGILSRTVFPVVPPRVDYELTAAGRSLEPIIQALAVWARGTSSAKTGGISSAWPMKRKRRPRRGTPPKHELAAGYSAGQTGEHAEADDGHCGADEAHRFVAVAGADRHAAEDGAERIGHVEGGVVEGGSKGLRIAGNIHQPRLERGSDDEAAADQETADAQQDRIVRRQREGDEHGEIERQRPADGAHQRQVGKLRPEDVADDHAAAEDRHDDRYHADIEAGDFGDDRRDIGEDGEHAAEARRRDAERQPDLLALQRAEFGQRIDALRRLVARQEDGDKRDGQQAGDADGDEHELPVEQLSEEGGERRADQRCDRQAQHDLADRLRALVDRYHRSGNKGGDAEIGAVRQAGKEAEQHEGFETRRDGAGEVAGSKDAHQHEQKVAPAEARADDGDNGSPHHDPKRIGADDIAGLRVGDAEGGGDVGQEAHDGEFARTDAEAADSERQDDQRHGQWRKRKRPRGEGDVGQGMFGHGVAPAGMVPTRQIQQQTLHGRPLLLAADAVWSGRRGHGREENSPAGRRTPDARDRDAIYQRRARCLLRFFTSGGFDREHRAHDLLHCVACPPVNRRFLDYLMEQ
ncbi:hxlR-like helix-turn-helix domain-containing protein [Ditylenchus destructor]|uniref:HxlR-like helix-turn-helix domain-containing protein n=1 Tax=Ditylenchus destructor TaxID=166010 RepID=A0AAD4MJJ7_9BILA|nr:hxlR-like helix-turn-helix domain-containing protein [Ditylenchus destructor]